MLNGRQYKAGLRENFAAQMSIDLRGKSTFLEKT
jgi:hypothetical protein